MLTETQFGLLEQYRSNIISEVANVGFTGDLQLEVEIAAAKFTNDLLVNLTTPATAAPVPVTTPTTTPSGNVYSA
jgi:hypothetical protein